MGNNSGWFLPWNEVDSAEGVTLERQDLGHYRVRVCSDWTEHHTYYFTSGSDAHACFKRCKSAIISEKSFITKVL